MNRERRKRKKVLETYSTTTSVDVICKRVDRCNMTNWTGIIHMVEPECIVAIGETEDSLSFLTIEFTFSSRPTMCGCVSSVASNPSRVYEPVLSPADVDKKRKEFYHETSSLRSDLIIYSYNSL